MLGCLFRSSDGMESPVRLKVSVTPKICSGDRISFRKHRNASVAGVGKEEEDVAGLPAGFDEANFGSPINIFTYRRLWLSDRSRGRRR